MSSRQDGNTLLHKASAALLEAQYLAMLAVAAGHWCMMQIRASHLHKGEPKNIVGHAVEPQGLQVLPVAAVAGD